MRDAIVRPVFLAASGVLLTLLLLASPCLAQHGPLLFAGQGILVGEVTSTTALVQVRLTKTDKLVDGDLPGKAGEMVFRLTEIGPQSAKPQAVIKEAAAVADHDFIVRVQFQNLKPGTKYRCDTTFRPAGDSPLGPVAYFKTLPGAEADEKVRFVVVTGMNYAKFHGDPAIDLKQHKIENNTELPAPYAGPDKHLGYPGLASILKAKPDFFVGTGDNVYYDTPDKPRAETLPEMRKKWHQQFVQPRFRDLFAAVPTYWEIDDHDYRVNDGDNSGDYLPSPATGRRVMLEQLPYGPMGDEKVKTYRTHRVSRDLQIWLVENRLYRSPNAMEDGPGKTIWGAEQTAWLKETLAASDAKFKILISPTPMIGPDDLRKTDNHCDVGGFQHERDAFFAWLKKSGLDQKNFYIVCGDRHWQYHSVDSTGIEEFSCGALVDANSRLGRKPGDPKSTDPQALIRQPYYQTPRSGGYLLVETEPAAGEQPAMLSFIWHDEHGKVLHTTVKK
ncbi:alkaline phosphatase D family protein [Lignipirellula cremea]|uniref:PhoD-like phosphatase n=1 Tax=Lignipirellula cremea TaxID=2528010 RepID=A0A518E162_9BACT|nr:alkaline phosphatase D family protein [Lignipirellula cremea]QDU97828.1 PhoD-like phosphatase [Lignipirellula cremea]